MQIAICKRIVKKSQFYIIFLLFISLCLNETQIFSLLSYLSRVLFGTRKNKISKERKTQIEEYVPRQGHCTLIQTCSVVVDLLATEPADGLKIEDSY